jgi:hypothetical protein
MHQTDLLLAILLLLVCFHLYVRGRYVAAYGLVTVSLLNLESFFLPFLAAPIMVEGLAKTGSLRQVFRKIITHSVILGGIFGVFVLGRLALGEQRARDVSSRAGDTVGRMARLGVEGPWHGLEALVQRPIDGAVHCGARLLPYALLSIAVTAWTLTSRGRRDDRETEVGSDSASLLRTRRRAALYVFASGLLVWSLSYVLWVPNDYYPPVIGIGRLTGEHAGAAIGAGLAAAGVAEWIASISVFPIRLFVVAFSCYVGALVSFGVQIQLSEYVAYWDETKHFWNALLNQIRDVRDGDAVLVELSSDSRVMPATQGFSMWAQESYFPMALPYFVDFPFDWKHPPRLYAIWPQVPFQDDGEVRKLHTPAWAVGIWPTIQSGNFIYLRVSNNRLERVNQPVEIAGRIFDPKSMPQEDMPLLKNSKVYVNLTSEPTSKDWFTLRDAKSYPQ